MLSFFVGDFEILFNSQKKSLDFFSLHQQGYSCVTVPMISKGFVTKLSSAHVTVKMLLSFKTFYLDP